MKITTLSDINNKLYCFIFSYDDEKTYKNYLVDLEFYKKQINDDYVYLIRFSTEYGWFEVETIDEIEDEYLNKGISVNLYDLFNVLDNCKDTPNKLISLDINYVNNTLSVLSFYNEDIDLEEFKCSLKIYDKWDGCKEKQTFNKNNIIKIDLTPFTMYCILYELNTLENFKDVYFIFENGKLMFESNCDGLHISLKLKDCDFNNFNNFNNKYENIPNFSIPFSFIKVIFNTVLQSNFSLYLSETHVFVENNKFFLKYKIKSNIYSYFNKNINSDKIFIVDLESFFIILKKLMNLSESNVLVNYNTYSKAIGEFSYSSDKLQLSILSPLATINENEIIEFSPEVFYKLFHNSNIDAISINKFENFIHIKYENGYLIKEILYDPQKFKLDKNK